MLEDFRRPEPAEPVQQKLPTDTLAAPTEVPSFMPRTDPRPTQPIRRPEPSFQHEPPLELQAGTKPHHKLRAWFGRLGTKQKVALITAGSLAVLALAGGIAFGLKPHETPAVASTVKKASAGAPVVTTVASTLTGLPVEPGINQRQVTGVMIENSTDARPQSGLDHAGVVFEAIAEGGITRFLALFQDSEPDFLGPVRSARPYYIQWCQGFDCAYAHVGGSPEALQNIKDWNIKDLNQFFGASYFQRIASRAAPHNVYTSIAKLKEFESSKGYNSSSYTGLARLSKEAKTEPTTQNGKAINFDYPGTAFDVHYDYDVASNSYKRSEGGAPHTVVDASGTTTQLSPKVVIAIAVPRGLQSDNKHNTYAVVGSGEAYIFQNGVAVHGTWTKASPTSQLDFLDDAGTTVKLNPGQTWISALDSIGNAHFN